MTVSQFAGMLVSGVLSFLLTRYIFSRLFPEKRDIKRPPDEPTP